ncbi:MAG TPA: hypothetical protein VF691_11510 [Cytophagaceae bacterium]|jgi:hypothetical protein
MDPKAILKVILLCVVSLLCNSRFSNLHAQTDVDVKVKDVPAAIKNYINQAYPAAGKIRFFKEIINDTVLYEAAFKNKEEKYELIFLSNNQLGSTKRQIKFGEINDTIRKKVLYDLKKRYGSFTLIKAKEIKTNADKIYEIKLKLKTPEKKGFFEIYYTDAGVFILEQEEILKSIPANNTF